MLQITLNGLNTESGGTALLNVEEEPRLAIRPVNTVQEWLRKHRLVTNTLVQVRNSFAG